MDNLEDIITASIEDAEAEPDPTPAEDDLQSVEEPTTTASETTEEPEPEVTPEEPVEESPEVKSPSAKVVEPKGDDFEKKFGISPNAASGRENRIPYSRVTKIVSKAQKEAQDIVRKELEPKVTEYETKIKEYEDRLASYDTRWQDVDKFEKIMLNDQEKFLDMLARIPAYQPFFTKINELFQKEQSATTTATPPVVEQPITDEMPAPDSEDGTTYTKDGLKALLTWVENNAVRLAEQKVAERYAPIENQFQAYQRMQAVLPKVQEQITEARKLPMFTESETEIVAALQADKNLTLEGAYNKIVVPKLITARESVITDRETIEKEAREKVLAELKKAPRSTSATTSTTKAPPTTAGPRSLEEIIADAAGIKYNKE